LRGGSTIEDVRGRGESSWERREFVGEERGGAVLLKAFVFGEGFDVVLSMILNSQ